MNNTKNYHQVEVYFTTTQFNSVLIIIFFLNQFNSKKSFNIFTLHLYYLLSYLIWVSSKLLCSFPFLFLFLHFTVVTFSYDLVLVLLHVMGNRINRQKFFFCEKQNSVSWYFVFFFIIWEVTDFNFFIILNFLILCIKNTQNNLNTVYVTREENYKRANKIWKVFWILKAFKVNWCWLNWYS